MNAKGNSWTGWVLRLGALAAIAAGLLVAAPAGAAPRFSAAASQELDEANARLRQHTAQRDAELEAGRNQLEVYRRKAQNDAVELRERRDLNQEMWMRRAMELYGPQILSDRRFVWTLAVNGVTLDELLAEDQQAIEEARRYNQALVAEAQEKLRADIQKWQSIIAADRAAVTAARSALLRRGNGR